MSAEPLTPAQIATLLPELKAKVEAMTPGPWRPSEGRAAAYALGANAFGDPRPELVFGGAEDADRDGLVALRNAAPALIATVEAQAKRIAELEAGLREAMKRWSTFAVHPDEHAERDRLRSLLAPKEG